MKRRHLLCFLSLICVFLFGLINDVKAQQIELTVRIKSVDLTANAIVAERNGRILKLSLTQDAPIKMNEIAIGLHQVPEETDAQIIYVAKRKLVSEIAIQSRVALRQLNIELDVEGNLNFAINSANENAGFEPLNEANRLPSFEPAMAKSVGESSHQISFDFSRPLSKPLMREDGEQVVIDSHLGVAVIPPGAARERPAEPFRLLRPFFAPARMRLNFRPKPGGIWGVLLSADLKTVMLVCDSDEGTVTVFKRSSTEEEFGEFEELSRLPMLPLALKAGVEEIGSEFSSMRIACSFFYKGDAPLGVERLDIVAKFAARFGLTLKQDEQNVLVERVRDNTASTGVIQVGDQLKEVNGRTVTDIENAVQILGECPIGESAKLSILRSGELLNVWILPR